MYIISSPERKRQKEQREKSNNDTKCYRSILYSQIMDEVLQISVNMQLSGCFPPVLLMYGKNGVRCP